MKKHKFLFKIIIAINLLYIIIGKLRYLEVNKIELCVLLNLELPFESKLLGCSFFFFICWSIWLLFLSNGIRMFFLLYNFFPRKCPSLAYIFYRTLNTLIFFLNLKTLIPNTLGGNANIKLHLLWVSSDIALKSFALHLLWIHHMIPAGVLTSVFSWWRDWPQ